jgi:hypothetical protein
MAAVGRDDRIAFIEVGADSDGIGLLARVEVGKPGDLAVHDLGVDPLFEFANRLHGAIGV